MFYKGKQGIACKQETACKQGIACKKEIACKQRIACKKETACKQGFFCKKERFVRGRKREEQEWFRKEIYRHAGGLAAEMNLRLFLDEETGSADIWRELCGPDMLLFVEDIAITDICYPKAARKPAFLRQKLRYWLGRLKQRRNRKHGCKSAETEPEQE